MKFDVSSTECRGHKNCVLQFSISGTKDAIRNQLLKMIKEIDADYGKPIQGIVSAFDYDSHVITPIWENKEY